MSEEQSGNLKQEQAVSDPDDDLEYAATLLAAGFPLVRHQCWRFEQTVVCEIKRGKPTRWRHLFACVECKRLQSLDFMC